MEKRVLTSIYKNTIIRDLVFPIKPNGSRDKLPLV